MKPLGGEEGALADALDGIAAALTRLAVVAERAYPAPPDRSTVTPASESALSRPNLKDLSQWENDDQIAQARAWMTPP